MAKKGAKTRSSWRAANPWIQRGGFALYHRWTVSGSGLFGFAHERRNSATPNYMWP